ncbi:Cullin-2 [Nosema bombycis CQ1]|uniref:Cullin-2 n=1 Tax=Nosema bombycis (strain CQ1 / CVCC 102059) TaxID=578461 RepID=R0M848_NOSB1|nr:Cullin-2 [Nosema bombycis CQ1]|eukprot:EOB14174.1 Cullin-2 [Nosema bombycis CQ1]
MYLVKECKPEFIKEALDSLKRVIIDEKDPLLYYTQRYEQYALEKIKSKYEKEVKINKIKEYTDYIYKVIEYENQNRNIILLKESFIKLEMILQDILVTQRKKFIQNEVYKILEKHKFPGEVIDTIMDTQSVQCGGRDGGSKVGDNDDQGNGEDKGKDDQGKDYPGTTYPNTYPSTLNPNTNPNVTYPTTYPTTSFNNTPHPNNNPINDFYALYNKKSLKKTYTFSSDTLNEILIIFNNLKVIPHGYEIMKSVLLKFINLRLESYSHLFDRRTETLYLFYSLFKNVVEVGFDNDPGCLKVFEKAFKENYKNLKPSLSSRLIEFSNNIVSIEKGDNDDNIDNLKLYKPMTYPNNQYNNQQIINSNYKEGALFRVFFHLFNLIEDKADFTERYSFELGRRLVKGITDLKKENHLIQIIKKSFGEKSFTCDAIRKSEIMLEDVIQKRVCKGDYGNGDINNGNNKARDMDIINANNINNSFLLLTQCAWPFEYSPLNLRLPDDFIKITQLEEKRNKKKRLYWLWEYSTVLLEINQKEIRVNFLQFLILNLFNTQKSISKEEIIKFTKITGKTLEWVILSLIRTELIMESVNNGGNDDKGNNKVDGHHNNTNQHENQVLCVLSSRPHKNNPYDYFIKENLLKDHEVNRIIYYQSLISRILKKNREIKSNELKGILVKNHTDRFDLDKEEVKKGLKGLIEKGVIEEEGGVLKYVP